MASDKHTIAVLMTSHNRCELTLRCLRSLHQSALAPDLALTVYLVDDGSTDGTSNAVHNQFPNVTVIRGSGLLYWARGMAAAWQRAIHDNPDAFLWINDDVVVFPEAISRLWETACIVSSERRVPVISVGTLTCQATGAYLYGASTRTSRWNPTRGRLISPDPHKPLRADGFFGNLVLVPRTAAEIIGPIESRYQHAMADADYWLRAGEEGVEVWVSPGLSGHCEPNPITDNGLLARLGRKRTPVADWWYFSRRFAPSWAWPVVFFSPYLAGAANSVLGYLSRAKASVSSHLRSEGERIHD